MQDQSMPNGPIPVRMGTMNEKHGAHTRNGKKLLPGCMYYGDPYFPCKTSENVLQQIKERAETMTATIEKKSKDDPTEKLLQKVDSAVYVALALLLVILLATFWPRK